MTTPQRNYKQEIVTLKYPFDISKLKARELLVREIGSSIMTKTFDVSCFSTVKFHVSQLDRQIAKDYVGYEHKVYCYRASKKGVGTVIEKMKFSYKIDHNSKFVHVNVELIPAIAAKPEVDLDEEEDTTE